MNSDYDITLHSDETSSPGTARKRFIESLGLIEDPPAVPDMDERVVIESSAEESVDEGVVLSSQPDDLDLSAVDSGSDRRTVSFSLDSSSKRTRTVEISITPKERIAATVVEAPEPKSDKTTIVEENLTLDCPECHGELVLQRRHLGIEGLCVWCHTPIIAAESARDSIVRIFPVLGRITKPFAAASSVAVAATAVDAMGTNGDVESATEIGVSPPEIVKTENPALSGAVAAEAALEVGSSDSGPAVEFPSAEPASRSPEPSGFGAPAMSSPVSTTSPPASKPEENATTGRKGEVSPFDLDALYAMSGFGQIDPKVESAPTTGFGETMADSPFVDSTGTDAYAKGFGAFLQSGLADASASAVAPATESWSMPKNTPTPAAPAPEVASSGFAAAASWGPPIKPAAPTPIAFSDAPIASSDDAPSSVPFDVASGFGSLVTAPLAAESDGGEFPGAQWANTFEEPAVAIETEKTSRGDDPGMALSSREHETTFAPSDLGNFTAPGEPHPANTAAAAPLSNDLATGFQTTGFGKAIPEAATPLPVSAPAPALAQADDFATSLASFGFEPPSPAPAKQASGATGFSTVMEAAPSVTEPSNAAGENPEFTFQSSPVSKFIFGEDEAGEKRSFAMPGNGFSTGSSSESEETRSLFPEISAPGPLATGWGISEPIGLASPDDAPVPLFPKFDSAVATSIPSPIPSAIESAPITTNSNPPLPQEKESTFSSIANPIEAPAHNVVSQSLVSKPKPTVRKGFIILMVVIIGLASGAALASFVLPIDKYVQAARTLMEKKFNTDSAARHLPSMPHPEVGNIDSLATGSEP